MTINTRGRPPPKFHDDPDILVVPDGKVNLTDPDSRYIKGHVDFVQGYKAQAAVDEGRDRPCGRDH